MKQAIVFVLALTLCSVAYAADLEKADLDRVLADETFLATVDMLQSNGVRINRFAKKATIIEDTESLFEDLGDVDLAVSFPLIGGGYDQLVFAMTEDGTSRVLVIDNSLSHQSLSEVIPKVACGTYLYSNTCNYGPWYASAGCSGGPLYRYENRTRDFYQYGRKVRVNYNWYSCSWMSQDSTCQANCS